MCARLLACPLCSQPGFSTLDALRAGLVSVATRPLMCPVCNEVLLGIDKLTIHLFGHTINLSNTAETSKHMDVVIRDEHLVAVHNAHNIAQDWSTLKAQQSGRAQVPSDRISLQPQVQSQDSFAKGACQPTIASDYDYEVIRVSIFPQGENCDVALQSAANLQEILKTKCMQYPRNDNVKYLESTQTKKASMSDFSLDWMEKRSCKSLVTTTVDAGVYRNAVETESNDNGHTMKEKLMMNLMNKESELPDFQLMPVVCADDASSEERKERQNLCNNAKEIVLKGNAEDREQNSRDHRKILQTCTKIFQTERVPKEKTERCDVCGFYFPDIKILSLHKQLVHEQDLSNVPGKILKNYSCHLCSKVFKMRGSLMVHMRVAHIGYNSGSFSKDGQIKLVHGDAGYNCPTCGKKFKKEQHVIQHLKIHEGKQWECDVCSKMFTTKYFLKKHKRLHSGEMPYKCKICDKNFTFQQSYHKHRLYHKDDKPHTCTTCGRSFKELSTLHNHERIHTGEKPFACETCGKCFRQRVSYLVHRRIHTGVMPYKCTMCGKSFRYKVSQRTHKCPAQASESTQQFDTIAQETNDKTVEIQATNTLQNNQSSTINIIDNEENKFVLIINAQGQHVLASQSEMNMSFGKNEQNVEFGEIGNANEDPKSKTWNTDNLNSMELEESTESIKKLQLDDERIKSTNDLFSLVMSRFENSVSSSTFQMEQLRVSSPEQKENSIDSYIGFPQISDNAQIDTARLSVEQDLTRDKDVSNSLQTINVESLKELLYGMDKK